MAEAADFKTFWQELIHITEQSYEPGNKLYKIPAIPDTCGGQPGAVCWCSIWDLGIVSLEGGTQDEEKYRASQYGAPFQRLYAEQPPPAALLIDHAPTGSFKSFFSTFAHYKQAVLCLHCDKV